MAQMTRLLLLGLTLVLLPCAHAATPEAPELQAARENAWAGRTDAAVAAYKRHLAEHPEDRATWLELIKTEGWRGNSPDALDQLADYRVHFGEDRAYLQLRARSLAWLGKTTPALAITHSLLADEPEDLDALTTRAIALQAANRPREALATLAEIRRLRPAARETADLARLLETPQRSSVSTHVDYSRDSDAVKILNWGVEGEAVLSPETRLQAGSDWQRLRAPSDSGLDNVTGARQADYRNVWVGGVHRFSPQLAADLRAGGADASQAGKDVLWRGGLDARLSDQWWLRPEVSHDYFVVSPRSVSLGVERDRARLLGRWTPDTRYTTDGELAFDRLSDGNRRWEVNLAPRRAMWRTQRVNIDLGVSARWFGFSDDLANGYYDPQHYQRYAVTGFSYWKINDNNGISLAASLGVHKDNTQNNFKFGGDLVVQGFFGIFDDWYLRVYASLLDNTRENSGAYRGGLFGLALTRRF